MRDNVLIIGATSGIARVLCHRLAERGCQLLLAARDMEALERMATDLRLRYGQDVATRHFEATAYDQHAAFFESCQEHFAGQLDGVILCHGYLPDQAETERNFDEARKTIDINFLSAVAVLSLAADFLEQRQSGYIAAISSVAGDRGRQSNYTYGASKAALTTYLQGLRNRLYRSGVFVITIKPGFVDTPMTSGLVDPDSPLVAAPEKVARDIDRAIQTRRNVLYSPFFWRWIMTVIRLIPEWLFKRLEL